MVKRIKEWFHPPHVCKVFMHYYGVNIKQCVDCNRVTPIGEAHFIKHQR